MREWIPSETVRKYMEKNGKNLSDFDKAALAWHHPEMLFRERTEALKGIMDTTCDAKLAGQIQERLTYAQNCLNTFFDRKEGMLYDFCAYSEESQEWESYGYYTSGEAAYSYARKLRSRFHIRKYRMIEKADDAERQNPDSEESPIVSALYYDKEGELSTYFSNEAVWNGELTEEDAGRFENCYVDILYPFRKGDLVREVGSGEIGVAETEKDDEEYEASRLRLTERQKQGYCWEYDDSYIVIEYVDEKGRFSHRHVPAAQVEYAEPDEENPKMEVLRHASWLLKGEGSIDAFQMACERFAGKIEGV